MIVVGVDGCKGGWIAARWDVVAGSIELEVHRTFRHVLDEYPEAAAIAIDIPIGLIECGRACDREARAVLKCRKPSVFPAPDPHVACEPDYHSAKAILEERCGKSISAQAFGIYSKVCEVNELMTPELQSRVIEVHPEICFWAMNNKQEVCPPKRSGPGYLERWELLRANVHLLDEAWHTVRSGVRGAKSDDILDAVASMWTAERWANPHKMTGRFPATEQRDAKGLRAEILY